MALTMKQMPIAGIPKTQYKPISPSIACIVGRTDDKSLKVNKIEKIARALIIIDNIIDIFTAALCSRREQNNAAEQGASSASITIAIVSAVLTGSERNDFPDKNTAETAITIASASMQKVNARKKLRLLWPTLSR
jgi:hypothetical protein